jgi:hypothetical protein
VRVIGGKLIETPDIFFPAREASFFPAREASTESRSDRQCGFPFKIQAGFQL